MKFSCSLACTQAHKIYCASKAPPTEETSHPPEAEANNAPIEPAGAGSKSGFNAAEAASSAEMKALIDQHPQLREQLREFYQSTLEEEWVETYTAPAGRGRGRGLGRGGMTSRSRGPWTPEKGFNRGLGRVRKLRQDVEDEKETGQTAEAFMRFLALVNQGQDST